MTMGVPIVHFSRRYRFSASHRLHLAGRTDAENQLLYGKCNNRFGHGHNYVVEVTVSGPVDPETGFVVDLGKLDALAQREIVDRFDGVHLNTDPAFAAGAVPSTENLVFDLERRLQEGVRALDPAGHVRLRSLRVEETGNNSFDLPCDMADARTRSELGAVHRAVSAGEDRA